MTKIHDCREFMEYMLQLQGKRKLSDAEIIALAIVWGSTR